MPRYQPLTPVKRLQHTILSPVVSSKALLTLKELICTLAQFVVSFFDGSCLLLDASEWSKVPTSYADDTDDGSK